MPIQPGSTAELQMTVSGADTAIALRSGDVPVLGTPRVLALLEEATVRAVRDQLDPGTTTVGMRIALDHVAPTAVGDAVTGTAALESVDGRRLRFAVTARAGDQVIASGHITRVVVDIDRFLESAHRC